MATSNPIPVKPPPGYDPIDAAEVDAQPSQPSQPAIKPPPGYDLVSADELPELRSSAPLDILTGMGKAVGSMGANLANLVPGVNLPVPKPASRLEDAAMKGTEFASYFIPELGEGKFLELLPKLNPVARAAAKALYQGFTSGAIATAETGDVKKGILAGGLQAGISGIVAPAIGYGLEKYGTRIQLRKIAPRALDYKAGFDPEALKKLDLKGNLRDTYEQIDQTIKALAKERNIPIDASGGLPVDIAGVFDDVGKKLGAEIQAGRHAGGNQELVNALMALHKDIVGTLGPNTAVSLRYLENAKESLGMIGDFVHTMGSRGAVIPPDLSAKAEIADRLYLGIRDAINKALPAGRTQDLNNQMAKLLPIRRSILKQIPVDDRQAAVNAMDLWASIPAILSGNPAHLALLAAVKGQRSMRLGNWLVRNAESPTKISRSLTSLAQRGPMASLLTLDPEDSPFLTAVQDHARQANQPVPFDIFEALNAKPGEEISPAKLNSRMEQLKKRFKISNPGADFTGLDTAAQDWIGGSFGAGEQ